jgi:hypothetical protein
MSHHAKHLRPMLPKAQSNRCLSVVGEPSGMLDRWPESLPWVAGVRRTGGETLSTHANCRVDT